MVRLGIMRVLLLLMALTFLPVSAQAKDMSAFQRDALHRVVGEYSQALADKNYERLLRLMPGSIHQYSAFKEGMTLEALRSKLAMGMRKMSEILKLESFDLDVENAAYLETEDGTPYVFIPSETIMALPNGQRMKTQSHVMALLELGNWRLMRMNDARQLRRLVEVYPSFEGIEIPEGKTEKLEESK